MLVPTSVIWMQFFRGKFTHCHSQMGEILFHFYPTAGALCFCVDELKLEGFGVGFPSDDVLSFQLYTARLILI